METTKFKSMLTWILGDKQCLVNSFSVKDWKSCNLFSSGGHLECLDTRKCKPFVKKMLWDLVVSEARERKYFSCDLLYLLWAGLFLCTYVCTISRSWEPVKMPANPVNMLIVRDLLPLLCKLWVNTAKTAGLTLNISSPSSCAPKYNTRPPSEL